VSIALAQGEAQNVELVGQIGGSTYAVAVQGDYAYIGVGPRLVILDISTPRSPSVIGQTDVLPDIVQDVVVADGYAYIADGSSGLRIIDISDPAAPNEVGYYDTLGNARDVAVAGDYAYVADEDGGLALVAFTEMAVSTTCFEKPVRYRRRRRSRR